MAEREHTGSLFEAPGDRPLADRVRPEQIDDLVGHGDLVGAGAALRVAIDNDRLHSLILWGPPGSGKTTLARIIAGATRARFVQLSAVLSGVKEVREVMRDAVERKRHGAGRTILFIDEIHRFNRAQQDAFLPHVEHGDVILIGATTENPSFGVIGPLLSRCRTYRLSPLSDTELREVLDRALRRDPVLAARGLDLEDDAAEAIVAEASGDARVALTLLEVTADALDASADCIRLQDVRDAAQSRTFLHDRAGDAHHDLASAFIKSLRNSDPDAAIYWMARMLAGGEDPLFICRRMIILAAEDVGLADPQALTLAVAAQAAFERLGLPEGEIPMAEACVYLATAPKSNAAYLALKAAKADVADKRVDPVPLHLRNAVTGLMQSEGYGEGYRYAHDEPGGIAEMSCLPEALAERVYYEPTGRGHEGLIAERLRRRKSARRGDPDGD